DSGHAPLAFPSSVVSVRRPGLPFRTIAFYPVGQCTMIAWRYSSGRPRPQFPFHSSPPPRVPSRRMASVPPDVSLGLQKPSDQLPPFATAGAFGFSRGPCEPRRRSFSFSPPDGYPLSSARTSSLLRSHLPPHIAS